VNYRHLGKQKTLAFAVYPGTGLADAREQRDAVRKVRRRATIRPSRSSWKKSLRPSRQPIASRRLPTNGL
jgi:hypothetical protein